MSEPSTRSATSRRSVLAVGGAAASVTVLAACGDDGDTSQDQPTPTAEQSSPDAPPEQGGATSSDAGPEQDTLVPVADVPVGGGVVLEDEGVVVTQPTSGEFRAFGATCTHQGCTITGITDTIDCSCHGSKFDLDDGSVVAGPASAPLPSESVTVAGDAVVRA